MIYVAGILALSPFVLALAVLAKVMRSKRTHDVGDLPTDLGFDDNDPGVDVDA